MNDELSEFHSFKHLTKQQKQHLLKNIKSFSVSRRERIFENGIQCPGIFCLVSGRVKIGIIASSGNERTIDVIFPGEVFGEAGIFTQHASPVYAQAITRSNLLCIHRDTILSGIQKWPEMATVFLELTCNRINQLLSGMYVCCLRNAQQRVNDFLLQHAQPLAADKYQGIVSLPVSKAVVASSLNLSAETFSRELHALSNAGLIRVERSLIHVYNLEELRRQCLS